MKLHHFPLIALTVFLIACADPAITPAGESEASDERGEEAEHEQGEHEDVPTQTTISAKTAQLTGIRVARSGPGIISDEHEVQGLLTPMESRTAQVMARFPGPIRSLRAGVGDRVRAGQPMATIESNLSLTNYTITAPISGVVLARNASLGTVAGEGAALYEIADLSELWVDLHIFGADAQHIRPGVPVVVKRLSDGVTAETSLERVLPGTATASQSTVARAVISNLDGLWRPGSAVKAWVTVDRQDAALIVPLTALQTAGEEEVVYVREGETYRTRTVKTGRRDAQSVEIISGLKAGEQVVVEKSFLVKADVEKSTVEEEH